MSVSSNSIIHYTDRLENITGIIREGFRIKYCSERITTRGGQKYEKAFPMVCFCDLPLTHSLNHIKQYGCYGIGLSKKWASRNGINPVQYIESNSHIGSALRHALNYVDTIRKETETYGSDTANLAENIETIILNSKNYKGDFVRQGVEYRDYKFYDEREWRYILSKKAHKNIPLIIGLEEYNAGKASFNDRLNGKRLRFSADDISYIIVNDETETGTIINAMREHYGPDYDDRLASCIKTVRQIREDF